MSRRNLPATPPFQQKHQIINRSRPTDQWTLGLVAAGVAKKVDLLHAYNALGAHGDSEPGGGIADFTDASRLRLVLKCLEDQFFLEFYRTTARVAQVDSRFIHRFDVVYDYPVTFLGESTHEIKGLFR